MTEDGTPYWAYVSVKPSRYEALVRAIRSGKSKDISDYGIIIKYGFDKQVPDAVKEEMLRNHHFDDEYMQQIEQEILAERKVFLDKKEDERIGNIVAMLKKKL